MKNQRFLRFGLGAIACLFIIFFGCTPTPETPLRVGINIWPGYEPLFLAQSLEYYDDFPVELKDYPSSTEASQALRNGDIEVAGLTMDETLLLAQTNPDVRVILITDFSNGADVLMAKPEIETIEDLKGKKIGLESNALGGYVLTRILENANLSLEDIEVVSLGVSEHEEAYKQNLVDAVITFEPVRSNLLKEGATILFDSTQIPKEIVDVLVTSQDTIDNRPEALEKLVKGWFRSLEYNSENQQAAAEVMAVREQINPEQFIESLELLIIPDLETNIALLSKNDPSLIDSVEQLQKVMLNERLLSQEVSLEPLFSPQIIQALP